MSTHNICFHPVIRKLFTSYPLLSRPMNEPVRDKTYKMACVPSKDQPGHLWIGSLSSLSTEERKNNKKLQEQESVLRPFNLV